MQGLTDAAKLYAQNPTEENRKKLMAVMESVNNASDGMKKAMAMPDQFDKATENVALVIFFFFFSRTFFFIFSFLIF